MCIIADIYAAYSSGNTEEFEKLASALPALPKTESLVMHQKRITAELASLSAWERASRDALLFDMFNAATVSYEEIPIDESDFLPDSHTHEEEFNMSDFVG